MDQPWSLLFLPSPMPTNSAWPCRMIRKATAGAPDFFAAAIAATASSGEAICFDPTPTSRSPAWMPAWSAAELGRTSAITAPVAPAGRLSCVLACGVSGA